MCHYFFFFKCVMLNVILMRSSIFHPKSIMLNDITKGSSYLPPQKCPIKCFPKWVILNVILKGSCLMLSKKSDMLQSLVK